MTACRTANLEWMMQGQNIDSVRPLVEAFTKVSNEDHRGTRLTDEAHSPPNRPPKKITLHPAIHDLFLELIDGTRPAGGGPAYTSEAFELQKTSISGVIYASEKSLPRDSNVIFRRPGGSTHRVGRIKSIFPLLVGPIINQNHDKWTKSLLPQH